MNDQINAYTQTDILGKSQVELVIKVYDGAIEAYQAAREAYEKEDNDTGFEKLQRARRFVTHLYTTLSMEDGGEIAEKLSQLYAFVINQTNIIEGTKDLAQIDDNINILNNLRLGWLGLKEQQDGEDKSAEPPNRQTEEHMVTTA